jgi:serine/threonine-protein kinase
LSNRRCPRCHTHYAAPARFCARDGTPLVEVAPARTDLASTARTRAIAQAAEPADPVYTSLTGQTVGGRYRIERRLGEGGMSFVYLAQDLEAGREVALKVLSPRLIRDPASVERLKREAAIAMRLDHPNVCPILGLGETPERLIFLVMPYLAGEALSEYEIRQGPLPVAEGVSLLLQICRGLEHAHGLQIVHRDLKPENVMLVPDRAVAGGTRAVVMDFGLAKERRADPEVAKLTQTGIVLGTPEFMSPEQIRGKPLDGRSDVYALGVLAFEMFTSSLPFGGKSPQDMMLARLNGQPLRLRALRPELPSKLEVVIGRALARDPAERFQSMEEFGAALASVTGTTGVFGKLFGR